MFVENPKPYLQAPPQLPHTKTVMIWGPPLSGKTTYAQEISRKFNVNYLNMEDVVKSHVEDQESELGRIVRKT